MLEFIKENLILVISNLLIPIIIWFFSKRHFQSRDLDSKDIEIIRGNLALYQNMIDDIDSRHKNTVAELILEIQELKKEICRLNNLIKNV